MRKVLGIVFSVMLVVGMMAPAFAAKPSDKQVAKKFDRIVAEVVSLDVAQKTIVVKEEKSGESRTISISAKAASELKVGDRVRIKLKAGTNQSAGVRVLKAKSVAEPIGATAAEPGVVPEADPVVTPATK
ncbi:MAG: hypothetical protein HGA80_08750 [Candidatus Omnitrophica bacterium]|nr:hypothetical protein [Candidatus Omnitrophota bacterium]